MKPRRQHDEHCWTRQRHFILLEELARYGWTLADYEAARRQREQDYARHLARHRALRKHWPDRNAYVVEHRDMGWTFEAIGQAFGICTERVRQIVSRQRHLSENK